MAKPTEESAAKPTGTFQYPKTIRTLPKGIESADWNQLKPAAVTAVRQAVKSQHYPILFHGPPGVGKSFALGLFYASFPGNAKWFRAVEFVRLIQLCRKDGSVMLPGAYSECGEGHLWKTRIESPDALFLDDIGLRSPTDSQYEILYELIDRRMGKPLFLSSNLSLGEIAKLYDDRIASRIGAGLRLEFTGEDRRRTRAKAVRV